MTPEQLTETEEEIKRLWEEGDIPYLLHLEGSVDGSFEQWLCDFFHSNVKPEDWVLASHRCHFVWQLAHERYFEGELRPVPSLPGDDCPRFNYHPDSAGEELIRRVKSGKSMFLYGPRFLCSAIVAGTASIAVGLALSIQRRGGTERVWNFTGDGGAFHGHFMEAVAATHAMNLPLTHIITDNDSSCGVTKEQRGSPTDWKWPDCVITVKYSPKFPHAGSKVRPQLKWTAP